MSKPESYPELKKYIDTIKLIDTHEHLPQPEERYKQKVDFLATFFPHYASVDLISAGMPQEDLIKTRNPDTPLMERWNLFEPWWHKIMNTGYARAVSIAVKDLYGVEQIDSKTVMTLSERIKEKNVKGLYKWVLKEKAGIDLSINDSQVYDGDTSFFAPVRRFTEFLYLRDREAVEALGRQVGAPLHSFKELLTALRHEFDRTQNKIVAVKIALAYTRPIHFEKVTFSEAETAFNEIYKTKRFRVYETPDQWKLVPEPINGDMLKVIQNYLVHVLIHEAIKHGLPIQIHTGLQEGNENILSNSNPALLTNLFMEYKEARFDIFHGGWPYCGVLGALAKNFPNVYIDMCWMHIISPSKARTALSNWLDEVPANKIMGFGGDYLFVEGAYGHSVMARENITYVLASKLDEGIYSMDQAKKYARWLLRENPDRLFLKQR